MSSAATPAFVTNAKLWAKCLRGLRGGCRCCHVADEYIRCGAKLLSPCQFESAESEYYRQTAHAAEVERREAERVTRSQVPRIPQRVALGPVGLPEDWMTAVLQRHAFDWPKVLTRIVFDYVPHMRGKRPLPSLDVGRVAPAPCPEDEPCARFPDL